jgi:hypothetical protein
VRYGLNFYIKFGRNSVFKGLRVRLYENLALRGNLVFRKGQETEMDTITCAISGVILKVVFLAQKYFE